MGKPNITLTESLADIMPPEYQELVETSTYGKEDRGWKDVGSSKELIEFLSDTFVRNHFNRITESIIRCTQYYCKE